MHSPGCLLAELDTAPQLWPTAVDELVRLQDPIHATARIASESFDFYGKPAARGDVLLAATASGNRDPAYSEQSRRCSTCTGRHRRWISASATAHTSAWATRLVRAMSQYRAS